jgi:glycosyltransferase involved in cell wall biosynthesis
VSQDGETGRTVPPEDPDALAEAIKELLEDDEARGTLGRAGRRRVEHQFTVDRMRTRVRNVYDEVLQ